MIGVSKFQFLCKLFSVFVVLIVFVFCGFDCICEKLSANTENQKPRPHGHPFCNDNDDDDGDVNNHQENDPEFHIYDDDRDDS